MAGAVPHTTPSPRPVKIEGSAAVRLAPTTDGDCERLLARHPSMRIRAITAHVDDVPVAIGGLAYSENGAPIAFFEGYDAIKRFPVAIHKAVLRGLADARARGVRRIIVGCDVKVEAAARWLKRLGFHDSGDDIWTWEA